MREDRPAGNSNFLTPLARIETVRRPVVVVRLGPTDLRCETSGWYRGCFNHVAVCCRQYVNANYYLY